jgi:hypothetical protein
VPALSFLAIIMASFLTALLKVLLIKLINLLIRLLSLMTDLLTDRQGLQNTELHLIVGLNIFTRKTRA